MNEYQRVWAEINLDNIASNIKKIRQFVNIKTKIMGIVKADAYGHGAIEISKVLLFNGADTLGVAIVDEGISLRENNIFVPILILGFTPEQKLTEVVLNNLSQTVFNLSMAIKLSEIAIKLNKVASIHLKIDTGMSRLGFSPNIITAKEIETISNLPNIKIEGIYTHFASSDSKDKSFTYEQIEKFNFLVSILKDNNINIPSLHVSNSGAILDIRNFDLDFVRAGIILYGLSPSNETNFKNYGFKPAMSLKTRISYIKEVPENVSVGYGRTYFTKKNTKIATIPVGYADGYFRSMSNIGRVIINGEYAPIIGNICMDQFMVDVTHIKNINFDDEVILFGKSNDLEISINEVAKIQKTINYEIVCNIGKRVPRVYMKNNNLLKTINYI